MKKILAFSSSNSKNSINQILVEYVAEQIMEQDVDVIKLTDYELPLFSVDLEAEIEYPVALRMLYNVLSNYDTLIISVNEHNRGPSAFFKNTIDWLSRLDIEFFKNKKVLVMSTSTGANGAKASLDYTKNVLIPRFGGEVLESFSFPSFNENFDLQTKKITDDVLFIGLTEVVGNFERQLQVSS